MNSNDDMEDREHAKARFQQLIHTVRQNTGGPGTPDRAGITRPQLALHCVAHGSMTRTGFESALDAALGQGAGDPRLVSWMDEEDRERVACRTEDGLRAVIAEQNMREEGADVQLQEQIAKELAEVRA